MLAVRRSLSLALLGLLALALTGVAEARIDRPAVAAPQGLQGVPAADRRSRRSTSSTAHLRSRGCPSAARSATSSSSRRAAPSARARSSGRTRTTSSQRRRPRRPPPAVPRPATGTIAEKMKNALRESQVAGRVDRRCLALDHRLALRALRACPRAHGGRPHAVEQALRLQHSLVEHPARPRQPASRPGPLVAGRGRDGVPGLDRREPSERS